MIRWEAEFSIATPLDFWRFRTARKLTLPVKLNLGTGVCIDNKGTRPAGEYSR